MIRVRESTHKELVKLAKYGDAMSDIIDKLLASYKDKSKEVSSRNIKKWLLSVVQITMYEVL